MRSLINKYIRNNGKLLLPVTLFLLPFMASCSDFIDQTSDRIANADENHLSSASDTIYSVLGIVNKMQAIADRTILLGEARADLVDVNNYTSSDLRDVALFNVGSGNAYNKPADYYAVINNCNYFLANAPIDLKNGQNKYIFRKEYAAVKAFRAWTYLQLALNYGSVPFVTDPILSKEESEMDYPKYDLQQICKYFIDDLQGLDTYEIPNYGSLRNGSVDSRMFFFPINILLGDLNLWAGNYRDAALCYYKYLNTRNGDNSASPIGIYNAYWSRSDTKFIMDNNSWTSNTFDDLTYGNELITIIPGDSIPAEGNYSQLRNIFNSTDYNNDNPSLEPSQGLKDISAAQIYCHYTDNNEVIYPPASLEGNDRGDLRFKECYMNFTSIQENTRMTSCEKYTSQNVHIYRQTMVYLRMAEALNRAGFPRFAYKILQKGVNNTVMKNEILPYYPKEEAFLSQFDFPSERYILRTTNELASENTIGIHSRGSGWTEHNEYYLMPYDEDIDSTLTVKYSAADLLQKQIEGVEDYIVDEEALEFAFEGYRFYDLMRVAMHRNDPTYLAKRVYARRGESNSTTMKSEIKKDLNSTSNWYLPLE